MKLFRNVRKKQTYGAKYQAGDYKGKDAAASEYVPGISLVFTCLIHNILP